MVDSSERLNAAFGERLLAARTAAGLTQAELGARVEPKPLHVQAVARYEAGDRGPSLRAIYRLAAALGISPRDLLPEIGSEKRGSAKRRPVSSK